MQVQVRDAQRARVHGPELHVDEVAGPRPDLDLHPTLGRVPGADIRIRDLEVAQRLGRRTGAGRGNDAPRVARRAAVHVEAADRARVRVRQVHVPDEARAIGREIRHEIGGVLVLPARDGVQRRIQIGGLVSMPVRHEALHAAVDAHRLQPAVQVARRDVAAFVAEAAARDRVDDAQLALGVQGQEIIVDRQ
ncbi:hypothetical protein HAV22_14205 [Massilia sp. TW-1]|uniref:Uncharacterized protein n=1 Tax=Telluria antibiotica TaxID=2717319 RepID=A0ABX0PBS7_9BURK|nr:hypothetical protein [Telluria antibiotica]NIA54786.1 hypothetical protein [Telluria antibiotica]